MEDKISQIIEGIYSSLKLSINKVKATLSLPAKGKLPPHIFITVIDQILEKYFNISLDSHQKKIIEQYESLHFPVPSEEGLPDRTVTLELETHPPQLKIAGKPPKDGENGYTDVKFDWKKKPGAFNPDGTFDWKKINSIPNIKENEAIATVHDKTDGSPGIDCFGKTIKQNPGIRHQIRWVKGHISRDDKRDGVEQFNLIARTPGIINFSFLKEDDPRTLEWVSVSDELTIKGNIDYSLGDLDCAASLDIEGDIKGNFNLHSDGHIHVTGTIEGQTVKAKTIQAELITNKCSVSANDEIDTSNITNAQASSEYIRVRTNASNAHLRAKEKIFFDANASLTGLTIHTKYIKLDHPVISGKNEIFLGDELFRKAESLPAILEKQDAEIEKTSTVIKEMIGSILQRYVQIEEFTKKNESTRIYNLMSSLKSNLVDAFKTVHKIDENIFNHCRELLLTLGEKNFEESVLRNVDKLSNNLGEYNTMQAEFTDAQEELAKNRKEFDSLSWQIKNDLAVVIDSANEAGSNAELKVHCAGKELVLQGNDIGGAEKEIRYKISDDAKDLTTGKLVVT